MMLMFAAALQLAVAAPSAESAKPEKKICRSSVTTGSILAGRLCMTRQKWREADQRDQANVDAVRHRAMTTGTDRAAANSGPP